MLQYRVSKYDPQLRDASGVFTGDDWTCVSDMGRVFDGVELTPERYSRVERAYISTAIEFLREAGVDSLLIDSLEGHRDHPSISADLSNGLLCDLSECADMIRFNLRNRIWCRLVSDHAFLHFGSDYYMYVGVPTECPNALRYATEIGLFVEPFDSPYFESPYLKRWPPGG